MKQYGAEFLGTFWLVLGGCGALCWRLGGATAVAVLAGADRRRSSGCIRLQVHRRERPAIAVT